MISYEELAAENVRLLGIVKALKEENAVLRSMLPSGVEIPSIRKEPEQKIQPLDKETIIAQRLSLFRSLSPQSELGYIVPDSLLFSTRASRANWPILHVRWQRGRLFPRKITTLAQELYHI